jgi:hypothetical protein
LVMVGALQAEVVLACDVCSVYSVAQVEVRVGQGPFAGVAEFYTHFGTVQVDGHQVPNQSGQYLDSSTSQLFAGYNFSDRVGVQFNAPIIYRSFQRPDGLGGIQQGVVSGLGDVSLLGHLVAFSRQTKKSAVYVNLLGGIKMPTGSTDRISEEFAEVANPVGQPSGIHGHDLTLGSGSFDGLVGATVFASTGRFYVNAAVQYAIRTEGAYDYQFANNLSWSGGPGFYILMGAKHTLSLQAVVSGEQKGLDTFHGQPAEDTGLTAVYLGPQINYTWSENLSAHLGLDWPVSMENTALQTVPDFRVRAGLTWRF